MNKVFLFEKTNVLKLRLEKLLSELGFQEFNYYQEGLLSVENHLGNMSSTDLLILDMEDYKDSLTKIEEFLRGHFKDEIPPVIIITESIESKSLLDFYQSGISDVLIKPFDDNIFTSKISRLVNIKPRKSSEKENTTQSKGYNLLTWIKDYEIGIEDIDNEHKEIIENFEKLYQLMKDGQGQEYYKDLVKFLEKYVTHHFENEEKFQKEIQYPGYEEHKEIHEKFKSKVLDLINNNQLESVTNMDLIKINLFVKDWLIKHIMGEDKKIGDFIKDNK